MTARDSVDVTEQIASPRPTAHGTLGQVSGATAHYTPGGDWLGTDTFTYTADDGKGHLGAGHGPGWGATT